jgi:hypothetical protein
MAASPFSLTLGITYTPPSAALNSGSSSFPVTGTYTAMNVGQIDVQATSLPGATVPVPFGSVAVAKAVLVKNVTLSDIGLRLNGSGSDTFQLSPGGEFLYAAPIAPGTSPMASATISIGTPPISDGAVHFIVLGD